MEALRIIPLGGLGEVGKNLTVYETNGEIIVVDAGLAFPRDEHLGVDLVLPDFSLPSRPRRPVRAVLLTHAHEDHVGAPAVSAARGQGSRGLGDAADARSAPAEARRARPPARDRAPRGAPDDGPVEIGPFRAEFIRMAHSVPDTVAIVLETATCACCTPATTRSTTRRSTGCARTSAGWPRSATAASTSCSATRRTPSGPGVTGSERLVGEAFRQIIPVREGRVLIASFASNVHRMQQAVDVAIETGRKVCVVGRSMRKNVNIARNLGYLEAPDDAFIQPNELANWRRTRRSSSARAARASRSRR